MLFFGRTVGEGFVIGGNVKVTITEVRGKRVRVSIDAPYEIDVFRTEIQERIDAGMEKSKRPERVPRVPVIRIGERLPGELMRRKVQ
jgi:carbon storage regulator